MESQVFRDGMQKCHPVGRPTNRAVGTMSPLGTVVKDSLKEDGSLEID